MTWLRVTNAAASGSISAKSAYGTNFNVVAEAARTIDGRDMPPTKAEAAARATNWRLFMLPAPRMIALIDGSRRARSKPTDEVGGCLRLDQISRGIAPHSLSPDFNRVSPLD